MKACSSKSSFPGSFSVVVVVGCEGAFSGCFCLLAGLEKSSRTSS